MMRVDYASDDDTRAVAENLPGTVFHAHPANRGYGANQKTCYKLALEQDADIIIMVHPRTAWAFVDRLPHRG